MFVYFWKTLILLNAILRVANNNFMARVIYNIMVKRRDRKVRKVQQLIRKNFLSKLKDLKARRCIRITKAALPPFYNFKEDGVKQKAKTVLSVFIKQAYITKRFKTSCLVYRMRIKSILNRFKMSKRIKTDFLAKLKDIIDKQIIKMIEYDNHLPSRKRINLSQKTLFYYKSEESCLNYIMDFNKLLFLKEHFCSEESVFDGKRLIGKYQAKYAFMTRVWKRYEQENYRYEAYIEDYADFITTQTTPRDRIFKTDVLSVTKNIKDVDLKLKWDIYLVKDSEVLKKIFAMDFKKFIFEFVGFQKKSTMFIN